MTNNATPSNESLIQRGYFFLNKSEFKSATLYFNRVLDVAPDSAEAYWGLLLCEYQCKESNELYLRLAVPISNNSNFEYAIKNATKELRNEYREIEKLVLLACHKKVVQYAFEGNLFLAKKWKSHYSSANSENKVFEEENKNLLNISKTDDCFPKFLLSLYAKYDEISYGTEIITSLKEIVKNEYATIMDKYLKENLTKPNKTSEKMIDLWANPLSVSFSAQKTADIGIDGKSSSVGDRFAFVAKQLSTNNGSLHIYKLINHCYSSAIDFEKKEDYAADKKAYFETEISRNEISEIEIEYIISLYPEIGEYYWKFVLTHTNNLTKLPTSHLNDSDFTRFMSKSKEQYDDDEPVKLLAKQNNDKISLEREYELILKETISYAENAIKHSNGEEKAEYAKKWADYNDKLLKDKEDNLSAIKERISNINDKLVIDNKSGTNETHIKGVILSVLSILILGFSIPVGQFIDYSFDSIVNLIKYPLINVFLIAFVAFLIISVVQIIATKKISKYNPKKFKMPIYYRMVFKVANILAIIILPLSIGLLVYSYIQYPANIGEIKIQSVDDVEYLDNAPRCIFSLESDLDFTDVEFAGISSFKGRLLGNKHTISNLKVKNDGFIESNSGDISDLKFVSLSFDQEFNLIAENSGNLNNITLSNIVLKGEKDFNGFVGTNEGKIVSCKVTGISGDCGRFTGFCSENEGEILASSVSKVDLKCQTGDGFAALNEGTIIGCSFSGKLYSKGTVTGFVDVVTDENASIERCYATGTIKGVQSVSAFIGILKEGKIENSYSRINATLVCTEYNDSIGGLVGQISPDDDTQIKIINCYFGGKIKVSSSKNSKKYEAIGGLVAHASTTSSVDDYNISINSCFTAGTYNLSDVSKGYGFSARENTISLNKTYGHNDNDIGYANVEGKLNIVKRKNMFTTKFITKTLDWDTKIWNVEKGEYPTLKEYVVPEENN